MQNLLEGTDQDHLPDNSQQQKPKDQPRDQEIAKLKAEIEKLKQIIQTRNNNMKPNRKSRNT